MRWVWVFSASIACGGAPETELQGIPEDSDASVRQPSKPAASAPGSDAGMVDAMIGVLDSSMPPPPPPPPDAGMPVPSCAELRSGVEALVVSSEACMSVSGACAQMIPGPCCPITVSDSSSAEAQQLATAMAAYKKACGSFQCTKKDCATKPSKKCDNGRCRQSD